MNILDANTEFLTIAQVSQYLGVTPPTVRKWVEKNVLTGYSFGEKTLRIKKSELIDFVQRSKVVLS